MRRRPPSPSRARRAHTIAVATPILILAGTKDSLLDLDQGLHDLLAEQGKTVRMEVYENGYHDFCIGPQGQKREEPLLDSTLAALESTLKFVRKPAGP